MKKLICTVALMLLVLGSTPVHAEESINTTTVVTETRALGVTPKLKINVPQIPKLTIKLNFNIDFGKYIPKF